MIKKESFIEDMIEEVKLLQIETIIEESGVELYRSGSGYNAYSPFRKSGSRTSFTVSPRLNIFRDWTMEGYSGNSIKYISLLENVSYLEASFILALRYNIIKEEDYEEFFKRRRFRKDYLEKIEQKHNKVDPSKILNNIAEPDKLDKLFRVFLNHVKLSEEHLNHLLNERKIPMKVIEEIGFFTFPSRAIMRRFNQDVISEFGSDDILKEIPGFFKRKEDKSFTFMRYKGIGIPIKNAFEEIIGIQIRRDNDQGEGSRYVWFSSSFAIDDPKGKTEFGTSSGSPIDVTIPDKIKYPVVFITEGKFKSIKIAETYNCISISVQGVGTWRNIKKTIGEIESSEIVKKAYGKDFAVKNIYIAFDADMCYNIRVYDQLKKMSDSLIDNNPALNIYYAYWPVDCGKGIDDLINNKKQDKIKKYEKNIWDINYQKVIDKAFEGEKFERIEQVKELEEEVFKNYFDKYMIL